MSIEEQVRKLWYRGYSRNNIGKILHIGHSRIQNTVRGLDKRQHREASKQRENMLRERARNRSQLYQEDYRKSLKIVRDHSLSGARAKFDPSIEDEVMLKIQAEGSP